MRVWSAGLLSLIVSSCGGTFSDGTTHQGGPAADGGSTGGSSSGGALQSGGASSGGRASTDGGGMGGTGTGGAPSAGAAGMGTGGLDCSTVGCGAPPICTEGCQAPCGCCPCAEGEHVSMGATDYVCTGGCYAPAGDAGGPTCSLNGRTYYEGDTFRAGDGCNTCTCTGGQTSCTKLGCTCDPSTETHQRSYVATDPAQCAVIDFVCPINTTYFQNDCGCGCEQGLGCPDWFDCMPGPGRSCDTNQIKTQCPYSGIAF